MARGVNKVILLGNLGADPETRYTASGSAVTNIRLATSDSWRDRQSGERQERTEWHRVVFFSRLAEIAAEYLRKGSQCYVEGQIRTNKWQGQDGQDRYTTEVVANDMQLLGGRGGGGGGAAAPARSRDEDPGSAWPAGRSSAGAPSTAPRERTLGRLRRRHSVLGACIAGMVGRKGFLAKRRIAPQRRAACCRCSGRGMRRAGNQGREIAAQQRPRGTDHPRTVLGSSDRNGGRQGLTGVLERDVIRVSGTPRQRFVARKSKIHESQRSLCIIGERQNTSRPSAILSNAGKTRTAARRPRDGTITRRMSPSRRSARMRWTDGLGTPAASRKCEELKIGRSNIQSSARIAYCDRVISATCVSMHREADLKRWARTWRCRWCSPVARSNWGYADTHLEPCLHRGRLTHV